MSYYAIVHHAIEDRERYSQDYVPATRDLIAKHGGEIVVSADACPVEGTPPAPRMVILRFPSEDAFREFYDDPDYKPLRELRHALTSAGSMVGAASLGA